MADPAISVELVGGEMKVVTDPATGQPCQDCCARCQWRGTWSPTISCDTAPVGSVEWKFNDDWAKLTGAEIEYEDDLRTILKHGAYEVCDGDVAKVVYYYNTQIDGECGDTPPQHLDDVVAYDGNPYDPVYEGVSLGQYWVTCIQHFCENWGEPAVCSPDQSCDLSAAGVSGPCNFTQLPDMAVDGECYNFGFGYGKKVRLLRGPFCTRVEAEAFLATVSDCTSVQGSAFNCGQGHEPLPPDPWPGPGPEPPPPPPPPPCVVADYYYDYYVVCADDAAVVVQVEAGDNCTGRHATSPPSTPSLGPFDNEDAAYAAIGDLPCAPVEYYVCCRTPDLVWGDDSRSSEPCAGGAIGGTYGDATSRDAAIAAGGIHC